MFAFSYNFCCFFVNNFIFFVLNLIIFIPCSLNDSRNFFMQSIPQYTSCLLFMSLNDNIVDIEKSDGICSFTFVVDDFFIIFTSVNPYY